MPFPYYKKLNRYDKAIYRQSDQIDRIELPRPKELADLVPAIAEALAGERRSDLTVACQELADQLLSQLSVPPVTVKVLKVRPSEDWGELHGLFEPAEDGTSARVTLWMKTAHRRNTVAFKTFLRTLLHELGHHLDYEFLELEDSFHTEGFFKRESSLFRQITAAKTT